MPDIGSNKDDIYDLRALLHETETSCGKFIEELDDIIEVLDGISSAHEDVTGRTNVLMLNCENLLEQQVLRLVVVI